MKYTQQLQNQMGYDRQGQDKVAGVIAAFLIILIGISSLSGIVNFKGVAQEVTQTCKIYFDMRVLSKNP